jgi:citrate synthase
VTNSIRTGVGRALDGDYAQFGLSVFRDLAESTSYLGLIAFSLTGQRMSREDEIVLDDLAVSSHVTEPRVWPIKLSWVVGSLGRAVPGYIAGIVALDSDILGGRVGEDAARLLVELRRAVDAGGGGDDAIRLFVEKQPKLFGFGVPVRSVDERLVAFKAALAHRNYQPGEHWKLAERFWRVARDSRRIEVNIIGATAALCLDLGFTPAQIAPMAVMLLTPTFLANATEAAAQSPEILRSLPDECVRYVGPAPRESPRAIAARAATTTNPGSSEPA